MANSTIPLQAIVDSARRRADLAPVLATGSGADAALDMANDIMIELCAGNSFELNGRKIGPLNWKWNRVPIPPFLTNSWQQDYAAVNLISLGWLERCTAVNVNSTAQPKQIIEILVRRELEEDYLQTAGPAKICWLPNNQLRYGTWGQGVNAPAQTGFGQGGFGQGGFGGGESAGATNATGLSNPGPGVVYTNPLGPGPTPVNPITQIKDPNGSLWVLTTYGTCGNVLPNFPVAPKFPTFDKPNQAADTVQDGTCMWTAVNPSGQGFRLWPVPPQSGVVWLVQPIGQAKPVTFTTLRQKLEPIPDDHVKYFRDAFYAKCLLMAADPKVRSKFDREYQLWLTSLEMAMRSAQNEQNDFAIVPERSVMESSYINAYPGPAWPFGGPWQGVG